MSVEWENTSKTINIFRNYCQQQVPIPPSQQTLGPNQVQKSGNHIKMAMQCNNSWDLDHGKIILELWETINFNPGLDLINCKSICSKKLTNLIL